MLPSLFNDVIGPVMRGPSSSHCAAALRVGRLARDLMDGSFDEVLVEFDRQGSLPTTHESQGSDMGLFGGLLGWEATDERLPRSPQALRDLGVQVRIETVDAGDPHPNTYRLTLRRGAERHFLRAISTGGGGQRPRLGPTPLTVIMPTFALWSPSGTWSSCVLVDTESGTAGGA